MNQESNSSDEADAIPEAEPIDELRVAELSPEEQMALYEESLKETDWGHQPC